jgi:hypothetical protein
MSAEPLSTAVAAPERSPGIRALLGIDLRSLACFRIGLGCLLLWDLWGRARTLREHYTGEGAYPREIAAEMRPDSPLFRVFLLSDRVDVQVALFVVFALLALLLVVGWRTRVVSVLTFVFLVSLVRRNHWACHTGDAWLEALAFWAMFLPLGARFSLDRLRGRARSARDPALSLATAGVLLQVAVFYVAAGVLKARYDVWQRGEAVWIFTHVVEYVRPFGAWLGSYPLACRVLTYATLVLEAVAPFLLFFPLWTARIRGVLFLVFAAFHLTLQATIHIGIFQIMCIVALTLFLPRAAWDGLARRVPSGLRDAWRDLCARAARRCGRPDRPPRPAPLLLALARNAFLVLALAVIAVSNVSSVIEDPYGDDRGEGGALPLPAPIEAYGRQMALVQSWNMFTDIERLFFGWFAVLAQDERGEIVDVLARQPFDGLRYPEHYARFFPNHNSRRYWRELAFPEREYLQKPMCDYLAREWERAGGAPLTHMAIFHVGRVPAQASARDVVKPIVTQWEAPHPPLRELPEPERARWTERRERWSRFLASLPRTVPRP